MKRRKARAYSTSKRTIHGKRKAAKETLRVGVKEGRWHTKPKPK